MLPLTALLTGVPTSCTSTWAAGLTRRPGLDVPATPDADEAREAAATELAKPVYHPRPSLWKQLWTWLLEHLDPMRVVPGAPSWVSVLIVSLAAVTLLAVLVLVLTRVTRSRRARLSALLLFDSDDRDAATLAQAADDAAAHGDFATAVIERYRAIIRSLDERGLIEDHPGLTAHEAAALASSALGALGPRLREAADLFDAVRFGDLVSAPGQDATMRELAAAVEASASASLSAAASQRQEQRL